MSSRVRSRQGFPEGVIAMAWSPAALTEIFPPLVFCPKYPFSTSHRQLSRISCLLLSYIPMRIRSLFRMLKGYGNGFHNEHRKSIPFAVQFRSMLELPDPLSIKLKKRQELRTTKEKNETINTAAFLIRIR
jgi:hypothetical protein